MYSNELVCNILDFLEINLNRKVSIEEVSYHFSYNRYYIMKTFKKEIGVSILVYMNRLRIWNSMLDIQNTSFSFTKIALRNGFYSLEYFSETFHQIMGVSPRVFQNYWKFRIFLDEEKFSILRIKWMELQEFVNMCNTYKKNKKPMVFPVRKLSIFR